MANQQYRTERDSLGEMRVPENAYWGAQTQRAVENFPISGLRFPRGFIRALGMVKLAAAKANMNLGKLDERVGEAIIRAAGEVLEGKLDAHFVVDIFQTGSGTSTNMNANEVIANRANEILGYSIGERKPVHPNDHVNMGQSSNDVIPTAMHISALESIEKELLPALKGLQKALEKKAREFDKIVKIGRTHLQDATPLLLGQEFGGYASMVDHGIRRLRNARRHLEELAVGGTAVGTGINTHPKFARKVVKEISAMTRIRFREAENHFEAQGARDAVVEVSGALKTIAVSLMKIANDIRLLGSGPRCGLGELILPAVQPGSSIMPGKVNPVMAEALCMACAQVIGNDAAIAVGGLSGNLELNAMMPLMAYNLLQSISLLANAANGFTEKCLRGIKADRERIASLLEQSLALATALVPYIGYDAAAALAKEAHQSGRTIREIAEEKKILPPNQLKKVFDLRAMAGPE